MRSHQQDAGTTQPTNEDAANLTTNGSPAVREDGKLRTRPPKQGETIWCHLGGGRQRRTESQCGGCAERADCREFGEWRAAHDGLKTEPESGPEEAGLIEPQDQGLPSSSSGADKVDESIPAGEGYVLVKTETVPIGQITVDADCESRPVNDQYVDQLVDSSSYMKIKLLVDEGYRLVDGRHRYEAAKRLNLTHVTVDVYQYGGPADRLRHAIKENVTHGLPFTREERATLVRRLFDSGDSLEEIARVLCVSLKAVQRYTKKERAARNQEVTDTILTLHKEGHSQVDIAAQLSVGRKVVRTAIGLQGQVSEKASGPEGDDIPVDGPESTSADGTTAEATLAEPLPVGDAGPSTVDETSAIEPECQPNSSTAVDVGSSDEISESDVTSGAAPEADSQVGDSEGDGIACKYVTAVAESIDDATELLKKVRWVDEPGADLRRAGTELDDAVERFDRAFAQFSEWKSGVR